MTSHVSLRGLRTHATFALISLILLQSFAAGAHDFAAIDRDDIANYLFLETPINGSNNAFNELEPGAILLYRTNQGRYGKLMITEYDYALKFDFRTYDADGTIFAQGDDYQVQGTFGFDLDAFQSTSGELDFYWAMHTSVERYLEPANGAAFIKWHDTPPLALTGTWENQSASIQRGDISKIIFEPEADHINLWTYSKCDYADACLWNTEGGKPMFPAGSPLDVIYTFEEDSYTLLITVSADLMELQVESIHSSADPDVVPTSRNYTLRKVADVYTVVDPDVVVAPKDGLVTSLELFSNTSWELTWGDDLIIIGPAITFTPHQGTGDATIALNVPENPIPEEVELICSFNGASFVLAQFPADPYVEIDETSAHFPAEGGSGAIGFTANYPAPILVAGETPWITIDGEPVGQIHYTVSPNPGESPRSGAINIGDKQFVITQDGITVEFGIIPVASTVPPEGGTVVVDVSANVSWQVTESVDWLSVSNQPSGQADGQVELTVEPNPTTSTRIGNVEIGSMTHVVTQDGQLPQLSIDPATADLSPDPQNLEIAVTANTNWTASVDSDWLSLGTAAEGSGNGTVRVLVSVNYSGSVRTGTVSIGGATCVISQQSNPSVGLGLESMDVAYWGGSGFVVTINNSHIPWTATTASPWITIVSGESGDGIGEVHFSVAENPLQESRAGTIMVNEIAFTITQDASPDLPPAPTNVTASDGDPVDKIVVLWDAVPEAEGYVIWRHTNWDFPDDAALKKWEIPGGTLHFEDDTCEPTIAYHYQVFTKVGEALSLASNSDTGYIPAGGGNDGDGTGDTVFDHLAWFGGFSTTQAPTLWTNELGWMYSTSTDSSDIMFFSYDIPQMGWFWSSDASYPWLWIFERQDWFYYYDGTGNGLGGWFTSATTLQQEWIGN